MGKAGEKASMSVVKKMMLALAGGLAVGIGFLLLREQLIASGQEGTWTLIDRKSTRLNSSHM